MGMGGKVGAGDTESEREKVRRDEWNFAVNRKVYVLHEPYQAVSNNPSWKHADASRKGNF